MTAARILPRLRTLRRFRRAEAGVSAVEFAIILPVMLTVFMGSIEVTQGITADRKVTLLARTLGDIVAQSPTINTTGTGSIADIFQSSKTVMYPYAGANGEFAKARVTVYDIDGSKNVTRRWCRTSGSISTAVPTTIPTALQVANTAVVLAESEFVYKPMLHYLLKTDITLKEQIYFRPRQSATVDLMNGAAVLKDCI